MNSYSLFPALIYLCASPILVAESRPAPPSPHLDAVAKSVQLKRSQPWIASNTSLSGLPSSSTSSFSIHYEQLDEPQIRVLRFEPRGVEAVRLIRAYENYYSPYRGKLEAADRTWSDFDEIEQVGGLSLMAQAQQPLATRILSHRASLVPIELLHPVELRQLPLSSGDQQLTLSLDDERLYPQQRTGLYFIELSGEEHPDLMRGAKSSYDAVAASQSIIQHSDLGLIWKTDDLGAQLFVYGFHLSTGDRIQQPHLSLYSHDAQLLHEQPISPDGTQLSLRDLLADRAEQVGYLQIGSGQDAYTVRLRPIEHAQYGDEFDPYLLALRQQQSRAAKIIHYCFTDRPIYRPSETAHVKGYIRKVVGNTVSLVPAEKLREMEVRIKRSGLLLRTERIDVQADSSFSLDVPIDPDSQNMNDYRLEFHPIAAADQPHLTESFAIDLKVAPFRRSPFVLQTTSSLNPDDQTLSISAHAQQHTGDIITEGHVMAELYVWNRTFTPEGWSGYSFGDHRQGASKVYRDQKERNIDIAGRTQMAIRIPQTTFPSYQRISSSVTVTGENGRALTQATTHTLHPAELYLGLRPSQSISHVGDTPINIEMRAIDTEGRAQQAPTPVSVRIEHQPLDAQHEQPRLISTQSITLDAQGQGRFPLSIEQAGLYIISAEGKDAQGQPYRTVITHQVDLEPSKKLDIQTDKKHYQAGDIVHLRLGNSIEGDILITLEREGVLRHLHHRLNGQERLIKIPLRPEDAPALTISALQIRGTDESASGIPQIISGSRAITIEPRAKKLDITIKTPSQPIHPATRGELSGQVRDAEGRAVPHAILTLYVVDDGHLEAGGYPTPAPLARFCRAHHQGVYSSCSLGQMLRRTDAEVWTNGVLERSKDEPLMMGHGSRGESCTMTSYGECLLPPLLQENPQPCILWLPHLKTDAEGRYQVQLTHPSTGTRYRVIAVAAHGADRFGVASATYQVLSSD